MVSGRAHTSARVSRLVLPLSYHDLSAIGLWALTCDLTQDQGQCGRGVSLPQKCLCASFGQFPNSELCAVVSRALSGGTDPIPAAFHAISGIWWILPAGAEGSELAVWLGAEFRCCVIKCSYCRALPAQLLHTPPEVWELPDSAAGIASPTQVWIIVCRHCSGCHLVVPIVFCCLARKP